MTLQNKKSMSIFSRNFSFHFKIKGLITCQAVSSKNNLCFQVQVFVKIVTSGWTFLTLTSSNFPKKNQINLIRSIEVSNDHKSAFLQKRICFFFSFNLLPVKFWIISITVFVIFKWNTKRFIKSNNIKMVWSQKHFCRQSI